MKEIRGRKIEKSHIIIYRLSGSTQKDQIKTPKTDKHTSQCSRIQVNMQKSVAFLYTTGKHMKKEIKNAIPFSIASKISWNKYNQGSKRLFNENFMTLEKEIEKKIPEYPGVSSGTFSFFKKKNKLTRN